MKHISYFFLCALFLIGFQSCIDNTIDIPPEKEAPVLESNATIADLLKIWKAGQVTTISEDLVVDAIVAADDETGNFYKQIIIQDETGGIAVRVEANNIYTVLPAKSKVYLRAKNLAIGDYNGLPQIGYAIDNKVGTIPFPLVGDTDESVLVPGAKNQTLEAKVHEINTLGNTALNTLIKLEDVQFAKSELGQSYADAENKKTQNRTLEDCNGNEIVVRTSGYASFAADQLAEGKGDLIAVYTIFGDTKQLTLRGLDDVQLTGERCGDVVVDLPTPNASISDVLALYTEGAVNQISSDLIFDAIVTADDETGNFYKQIVVQDETGAINIQIDGNKLSEKYSLGKEVVVKAKDLYVGDFNKLPQIGILKDGKVGRIGKSDYAKVVIAGSNKGEPAPKQMTITDLLNSNAYNQLVQVKDVEFLSKDFGKTYADAAGKKSRNYDLTDCDGNKIILRTSGYASFADVQLPQGNGSIKAIFSVYDGTKQLIIRKVQDVNMQGERCDGGGTGNDDLEELNYDCEDASNNADFAKSGWTNVATKGSRVWRGKTYSGNTYLKATAYNDTEPAMEAWLITPAIKMNGNNVLSFKSAMDHYKHDGLSVYISSDFSGDVASANWEPLNAKLAGSSNADYEFVDSGAIDLSAYNGKKIVVAFKYEGTGAANTTSFSLDDIVISK